LATSLRMHAVLLGLCALTHSQRRRCTARAGTSREVRGEMARRESAHVVHALRHGGPTYQRSMDVMEKPGIEPVDTPSRRAPQVLCTEQRFGRNERRKGRDVRLRRKDTEIQDMKTESKQHNRRWEDGHETMQIENEVHRRRRRGMVMPLERRVRLVEAVRMHEAHDASHRDETGNQCSKDLPGLGDRDSHHGYLTPVPPFPSPPASRRETREKSRPMHKCMHREFVVSSDGRDEEP